MISPSIFKDVDGYLVFRLPPEGLNEALTELMEAEEPDKRWEIIEYRIRDGRFEVRYTYPEEIDREENDRRERILKERFHDKTVVYPSWPEAREQRHAIEDGLPVPPTMIPRRQD